MLKIVTILSSHLPPIGPIPKKRKKRPKRPKPRPSENSEILESSVDPVATTSFTVQNEISEETILSSEPSNNIIQNAPQNIQAPNLQTEVPENIEPQPEDTSIIGQVSKLHFLLIIWTPTVALDLIMWSNRHLN